MRQHERLQLVTRSEDGSPTRPSGETASHRQFAGERERTLAQIAALAADLADIKASSELVATDDEHDPEGATIAFERSRIDALLTQAREHLVAIDSAQARVASGDYGVCERCGEPIGAERLAARPTTSVCIACAH